MDGVFVVKGLHVSFYLSTMLVEEHLSAGVFAEESLCGPCPGPFWSWCWVFAKGGPAACNKSPVLTLTTSTSVPP